MMDQDPTWQFPVGNEVAPALSTPETAEPLAFIRFEDVEPALATNDFVERLLVAGAMSVLYGQSNSGKTFLALDLALHIAQGAPWFGREITQGPVLYLALEGGSGIKNRIVAYRAEHGLDDVRLPFFVVPQPLNLLDPAGDVAAIINTTARVASEAEAPVALIVIDTLSRAMAGGNENAPEDMTALVAAGDRIRKETGAHVMWVHHSGKDETRGARGHSSLRAATDTEIEIIADDKGRRAEVRKQRDLDGGDVICYELQSVELGTNSRGKPVTSCVVRPADPNATHKDPVRSLTGHARRAYEVLLDTVAGEGQGGFSGVPARLLSVTDTRWREQFYACAMPGAEQGAKQRAFLRAAAMLQERRIIAMNAGRVWIVLQDHPGQDSQT
ncbi:helicase RepA family protein [Acidocella sp. KAb 2-4]|uniref:helicase RepA family protein n=1 Tax=Acidocella sp. KAb 2-4 TaxID=2885158 RepID=UPI001D0931DD|nr:helicase RepA family protein [Acidocella sp. KAb 2-4]MCB5945931.1 helicase RepA family protein [Acidocella sp. KAb 2-4]